MIAQFLAMVVVLGQTAAVTYPPEATAAFERGRRLWELGTDLPGARAALDEAIRLAPGYADAYLYRALVTSHDDGLAPARADFEYALKLAPDGKEAHRFFGEALFEAGEIDTAEKHLSRALELDEDYADVLYLLGKLHRKKGRYDQAVALLERHSEVQPKGSAHHQLGEIQLERGDRAKAAHHFELDLAVDPSCYESRINLAGLHLEDGAYEAAKEQYETSLTYHPADARALSGLGRAYLALGDYERALGTLRSAQDLSPDDERVAEALASARWKLKLRYGWPFAVVPGALVLGLIAYVAMARRRKTT